MLGPPAPSLGKKVVGRADGRPVGWKRIVAVADADITFGDVGLPVAVGGAQTAIEAAAPVAVVPVTAAAVVAVVAGACSG